MLNNKHLHNLGTGQVVEKKAYFNDCNDYSTVGLAGTKGKFLLEWRLDDRYGCRHFKTFDYCFSSFLVKCKFVDFCTLISFVRLYDLSVNCLVFSYSKIRTACCLIDDNDDVYGIEFVDLDF